MGYQRTTDWNVYTASGTRKYLGAAQRVAFLDAARLEPEAVRVLCVFLVLAGCRISEALGVRANHIDAAANTVLIRTSKRRKLTFRTVPLPASLVSDLSRLGAAEQLLWSIHRTTALRWVKRVMTRAGIDGPMACCRGTRHTFAMHAAKCRVPPVLMQRWLGHASLDTTCIYIEAVGNDEREFAEWMW